MRSIHNPSPRLRDIIGWPGKIPYLMWRAGFRGRSSKRVKLRTGESLILRPPPATDLGIAMEVFLSEVYKPPIHVHNVKSIVDLGANVGYSVIYWARLFPSADIDAFEPHPVHVRQLEANIRGNHLSGRVTVFPWAAGNRETSLLLTDAGARSELVENPRSGAFEVQVRDWLLLARNKHIDLLKIDIEGGEYDILMDPRFGNLDISRIVLEWHASIQRPQDDHEIKERLSGLGYHIESMCEDSIPDLRFGLLWAFKPHAR